VKYHGEKCQNPGIQKPFVYHRLSIYSNNQGVEEGDKLSFVEWVHLPRRGIRLSPSGIFLGCAIYSD
jgi:hypothetical protein